MIEIPKQLQKEDFRFVKVKPKSKKAFETDWGKTTNYKFNDPELLNYKGNYGTLGGYGFLINLDCDEPETVKLAEQALPETFTVQRKEGKRHYRFICKNQPKKKIKLLKDGKDFGEIQTFGGQMVAPNCEHEDGSIYKVVKDLPIAEIPLEQLKFVYKDYIKEHQEVEKNRAGITTIPIETVVSLVGLTRRGDEYQGPHPLHDSKGGANFCVNPTKNIWHCFRHDTGGDAYYFQAVKLGVLDCSDARPGALRGNDFIKVANSIEEITNPTENTTQPQTSKSTLKIKNVEELFNLKPNKDYIVQQFIYPQNIIMLFSPPKNYKSILALKLCMDITNGKPFFGLKTKKSSVLYCDRENNENLIHQRLHALRKGSPKEYRRKKFPLYFLIRQGDLESEIWVRQLIDTVKEHDIKMVVFDTMKRYSTNFDENNANDINRIYTGVYQPLIDECNCSILFLHHTNKRGEFRGSGDFLGMVDSAYSIEKLNGKSNDFKVSCLAARGGEIDEIQGTVELEQDEHKQLTFFKFIQKSQQEIQETSSENWLTKKRACNAIIGLFLSKGLDRMKRSDMFYDISIQQKDEISEGTFKRALEYLKYKNVLVSDGKGWYTKIDDWIVSQ